MLGNCNYKFGHEKRLLRVLVITNRNNKYDHIWQKYLEPVVNILNIKKQLYKNDDKKILDYITPEMLLSIDGFVVRMDTIIGIDT